MEASQEQKEEIARKRQPFDFGIKELKRVLDRTCLTEADKNKTIKIYKERLYERVEEVKTKMEKVGLQDATDTKGAVITTQKGVCDAKDK